MNRNEPLRPSDPSLGVPGSSDEHDPPRLPERTRWATQRAPLPLDRTPPSWFDLFDPRQPEAFLAFCSAWCALQMWFWPNEFAAANALISLDIGLRGHERIWAIFGGTAALFKLGGLACRKSPRWQEFSAGLRASGLFMSIVFWLIVGLSRMLDFPHLITPVALTGLGMAAAFELATRHDPRETWR